MTKFIVSTVGEATSSDGRPPSRFAFNPTARPHRDRRRHRRLPRCCRAGRLGLHHSRQHARRTRRRFGGRVDTGLGHGHSHATTGDEYCGINEVAGIGIGLPGPVEHLSGLPRNPPIMPGWDGFDVPVLVDNDVNIMALGERATEWSDDDDLLFVKVATGIGAGIIGGGQLQRSVVGAAGDLGHVRVPVPTKLYAAVGIPAVLRPPSVALPSQRPCVGRAWMPRPCGTWWRWPCRQRSRTRTRRGAPGRTRLRNHAGDLRQPTQPVGHRDRRRNGRSRRTFARRNSRNRVFSLSAAVYRPTTHRAVSCHGSGRCARGRDDGDPVRAVGGAKRQPPGSVGDAPWVGRAAQLPIKT